VSVRDGTIVLKDGEEESSVRRREAKGQVISISGGKERAPRKKDPS